MSPVFSLSSITPVSYGHPNSGFQPSGLKSLSNNCTFFLNPNSADSQHRYKGSTGISSGTCPRKRYDFFRARLATKAVKTDNDEVSSFEEEENTIDFDWGDEEDEGCPWVGAIVYKRNPSILHVEYCTTLERLGLGKISSEVSRSRASAMGLRVTKAVKDYSHGTPVLVSVDITRKKHKLRLDGIIRTVITLFCNRCGEPAAESVFSNFSLLLTEEPIEESEIIDMGTMYGEGKSKTSGGTSNEEEDEDEALIDMDDRLYFPPEEKEIDISKNIRDMVHVEITINAVCDPKCKGLCLKCGMNLNTSICKCSKEGINDVAYGPLGGLRKKMQEK